MKLLYERRFEDPFFVAVLETKDDWQKYTDALNLSVHDHDLMKGMKDFRKREFLASRAGFQFMLDKPIEISKDHYGKPWLKDDDHYISISHSENRVALIYHERKVGIDIQIHQDKIIDLAPKFITESEIEAIPDIMKMESIHYYWGAKESMFKAYGEKKVDFKKHLDVPLLHPSYTDAMIARFNKPEYFAEYYINVDQIDNFYLVYAIEK